MLIKNSTLAPQPYFNILPNELIHEIFTKLQPPELISTMNSCKRHYIFIAQNNQLYWTITLNFYRYIELNPYFVFAEIEQIRNFLEKHTGKVLKQELRSLYHLARPTVKLRKIADALIKNIELDILLFRESNFHPKMIFHLDSHFSSLKSIIKKVRAVTTRNTLQVKLASLYLKTLRINDAEDIVKELPVELRDKVQHKICEYYCTHNFFSLALNACTQITKKFYRRNQITEILKRQLNKEGCEKAFSTLELFLSQETSDEEKSALLITFIKIQYQKSNPKNIERTLDLIKDEFIKTGAYAHIDDINSALRLCNKLKKQKREEALAYITRIFADKADYRNAFKAASKIKNSSIQKGAFIDYARALAKSGDRDRAQRIIYDLKKRGEPNDFEATVALKQIAEDYLEVRDYKNALSLLQNFSSLAVSSDIHLKIIQVLLNSNQIDLAYSNLLVFSLSDQIFQKEIVLIASAYIAKKKYKKATILIKKHCDKYSKGKIFLELTNAYINEGVLEKARGVIDQIPCEDKKSRDQALSNLSVAFAKKQNYAKAFETLNLINLSNSIQIGDTLEKIAEIQITHLACREAQQTILKVKKIGSIEQFLYLSLFFVTAFNPFFQDFEWLQPEQASGS